MLLSEFDYQLPEGLIAQRPSDKRENSRMMVLNRASHEILHKHFYDIVDLLDENHILILNNTKVIPARLYGYKDTGAKIEVFLLKERENKIWEVLIKPSKRVRPGTIIKISDELSCEVRMPLPDDGKWLVQMIYEGDILSILHKVGNIPLPPYIERKMTNEEYKSLDFDRYQTVYAQKEGAVAAPTAGLHFTKEILQKLEEQGTKHCFVTLNVGLGTFKPVKCENILDHKMDSESFEITEETAEIINKAKADGKNIVAVGTTSVRVLESCVDEEGKIIAQKKDTSIFIYPSYNFKVVDALITNFHLPESTLIMLVSAFAGYDNTMKIYHHAVENRYRFFSFGDAMFIE